MGSLSNLSTLPALIALGWALALPSASGFAADTKDNQGAVDVVAAPQRSVIPNFEALEGLGESRDFSRGDLQGKITVLNLWYEF